MHWAGQDSTHASALRKAVPLLNRNSSPGASSWLPPISLPGSLIQELVPSHRYRVCLTFSAREEKWAGNGRAVQSRLCPRRDADSRGDPADRTRLLTGAVISTRFTERNPRPREVRGPSSTAPRVSGVGSQTRALGPHRAGGTDSHQEAGVLFFLF